MTANDNPPDPVKSTPAVDKEIEAIRVVLGALEGLEADIRQSVLEYVLKRLKVQFPSTGQAPPIIVSPAAVALPESEPKLGPTVPSVPSGSSTIHIKAFKEQKKPRSANEMAALVAYYLGNLAPERKQTLTAKDVETHFKIAGFPLPGQVKMTLPNAKAAGYFDAVGDGDYRLNAVGHNLVVHSMPRGANSPDAKPARKKSRPARSLPARRDDHRYVIARRCAAVVAPPFGTG